MITCPAAITTATNPVSWNDPVVTDNANTAPMVSCMPSSGSTFPIDMSTDVTCTATDAAGNQGSCMFAVLVGKILLINLFFLNFIYEIIMLYD